MYYVNDKAFQDKCTAREYSFQLCHQFQSANKYWKTVNVASEDSQSTLDSYAVIDLQSKDESRFVYEAIIVIGG